MKQTNLRRAAAARLLFLSLAAAGAGAPAAWAAETAVTYEPAPGGAGAGKHVVFLTGDEEYRSEEGLPMLAKVLSQRHGFKCTVLFAVDPDGTINPNNTKSLPGAEALDTADAIVMLVRFRAWPDEQMKKFVDAYRRGVPIVALRTSTHAFRFDNGPYKEFNDFGERVLGEQWVSHWGKHKAEATRGVVEPSAKDDPVLRGVTDVFGDSDVYEAYPPADAKVLLRGRVLKGMTPESETAEYRKKRASDGVEQPVNDPMMPVAWTRVHRNEAGKENRILCTTMGAATDLQSEGLRRLVVNGVYWGLGMDVPAEADVRYVGDFRPTMYGFNGYVKGVRPADHALNARPAAKPSALQLRPGDHFAIVGNALADRLQHFNWFESLVHAGHPGHRLVVRNLAVAGDEVAWRHRSENFGTPDEWLSKVRADVVFAFFGFNESFKGPAGLPAFRAELDKYLKHLRAQRYGKSAPRVVLFSPVAAERHQDANFPDPAPINANLKLYTSAMAEVAAANGVQFVDLFTPSQALYADARTRKRSLSHNGLHLTDEGYRLLAPAMYSAVFGQPAPAKVADNLRAAVDEKNRQWHARYRTVDGYNVYGGRSKLSFPSAQPGKEITNFDVMQQEMSQRDVLTANRDPLVWAAAQGKPYTVNDSNLPPTTPVPTNKPGPAEQGQHAFLTGEQAIEKMKVHSNCEVNLFASEEKFPQLVNPVQMAWDTRGRLWVAVWPSYPERTPTSKTGDSLLILEDTDRDGRADTCTPFLEDLNCPTGFQFYKDGVLVMQAPDLWFVRDTDGDGKADWKERILMGLDSADSHHTTNSMCLDPGGAVYLSDGVFHRTQVETPAGPLRNDDAAIYRFFPRTGEFETYIAYKFANPHGRVFDYWGNDLVTDATGNHTYFAPAISGKLDYPKKHATLNEFWKRPSRPSPGTGLLTSRHFPAEFQGNLLNMNVISFQGIYRVKVLEDSSSLRGETQEDLVSSADPNFRPTAVNVGPDGAVYFADWHNPIIGHMQHHLRDPSRDHAHGRVYRLTYKGRPLATAPRIDGQPIPALLDLLKEPENQTRELAKIELGKRPSADVIAAAKSWASALDRSDPAYEHHMAEALWVHQWHNAVDVELLRRVLQSPEPRARAAATRVLCYWRDRVPGALKLLAERAVDENPRVRLEAVRAASFFGSPEGVNVALAALKHPTDYYLDYTLGETMRQLEPHWRESLAKGGLVGDDSAGAEYLIRSVGTPELLRFTLTPAIARALLGRADVTDADRHKALSFLAKQEKSDPATLLLTLAETARDGATRANVVRILPQMPRGELRPLRERVAALAAKDESPAVRQHAIAALAQADESVAKVWADAGDDAARRLDVVSAVPLIHDVSVRGEAYEKVMPLLSAETAPSLRRAAIRAAVSIAGRGATTFPALASLIEAGRDVPDAAAAMRILPAKALKADRLHAVVDGLVRWAREVPTDRRTRPDYLTTVQFAQGLVSSLPADHAAAVLKDLRDLRVTSFVVTAVREQMRYDTPRLVVEAGKAFELTFENPDFMPHNLLIIKPGSRERVGLAAASMKPDQLDGMGRAYVPNLPDVLAATRLLDNGQRHTIKLTAPTTEGNYEYVCTFPDHWRVMWGTLVVTKDIDAYYQANPGPAEGAVATPAATVERHHHDPVTR